MAQDSFAADDFQAIVLTLDHYDAINTRSSRLPPWIEVRASDARKTPVKYVLVLMVVTFRQHVRWDPRHKVAIGELCETEVEDKF